MQGAKYRLCRKCGQRWNVSALEPGGRVYICPVCDWKARRGTDQGRGDNAVHR